MMQESSIISQLKKKTPMIVSIEGNIGTGKSTLLSYLSTVSSKDTIICYEPVHEWLKIKDSKNETLLSKFYKDPKKYGFLFQLMVLKSMNELVINTIRDNPQCRQIICERSVLSSHYIFTKMLHDENFIDEIEYTLYKSFFDLYNVEEITPDKIIHLYCSPEKSLENIKKRNRTGENNITIDYLQKCNQNHRIFLSTLQNIEIIEIDVETDLVF